MKRLTRKEFTAAALLGPYVADCPTCFDAPRRFADDAHRDVWVRRHRADSGHAVSIWTDEDYQVRMSDHIRRVGLVQQ